MRVLARLLCVQECRASQAVLQRGRVHVPEGWRVIAHVLVREERLGQQRLVIVLVTGYRHWRARFDTHAQRRSTVSVPGKWCRAQDAW